MNRHLRSLGSFVVLCIFAGAAWLLYHEVRKYHLADIRQSIELIPDLRLLASFGLMIVNYLILVGYDALALKAIGRPLPLGKTALVSFVGCACSYNFGALLGGSSVRYRFYSAWGFTIPDVVRLVLMLAVTFWVGALGLAGLSFVIEPLPLPPGLGLPIDDVRPLGFALLAATTGYLLLTFFVRKPLHFFGREFALPCPKIAFAQTLTACADLVAAAGCLYMLMPSDLGLDFLTFLAVYLLATVVVVLTHVPGGAGVFELVILSLSQTTHPQAVIAALLAFRVIYYLLPLLFAALLLAGYEVQVRRHQAEKAFRDAGRWMWVLSHILLSYVTFAAGVILLLSGSIPPNKLLIAQSPLVVPPAVQEAAHILGSMAGAGLLLLSRGIERRLASVWKVVVTLLLTGMVCALLKGFDWHEAVLLSFALAGLLGSRRRFYRKSSLIREEYPLRWFFASAAIIGCAGAVALFAFGDAGTGMRGLWEAISDDAGAARAVRGIAAACAVMVAFTLRRLLLPLHKQ
ncbi:lysylphosphatidylglycerol synthetase family protein [Nitratidesulfovibrio vulgaris]|uniref:lysylphosphatidylglycerol synthetase family protein n=1 Tax=Nitratidesulfovibrio vulgaris TaxID=881 RepID=UPI00230193EF|nr:lysylphosphatidylglycerol synthetase family protein [Nitratidesulfovibrio vulgaris]WCB47930.1 lysylphosphatidylglycerol synthetase family protein [Nitratidesulfovibrio vulgaris]